MPEPVPKPEPFESREWARQQECIKKGREALRELITHIETSFEDIFSQPPPPDRVEKVLADFDETLERTAFTISCMMLDYTKADPMSWLVQYTMARNFMPSPEFVDEICGPAPTPCK